MTDPPEGTAGVEIIVTLGHGRVWVARARAARQQSWIRLVRLRRWLGTPQGRRVSLRAGQGLAGAVLLFAGGMTLRRLLLSARGGVGGLVASARRLASAAGTLSSAVRRTLSWHWLTRLFGALLTPQAGRHTHCVECHARIRADARVCFRCRARQGSRALPAHGTPPRRRSRRPGSPATRALKFSWRVLTLSLYHRCPDCRRQVHAEARRCYRCGAEQRRRGALRRIPG
jgi:hypothetical protein